jgi:teichuronic acid biosynthesis glycosyltransferase TuaG
MNNEKLVSIITPMYNAEKYILETINSVQLQTYQNWEMIIVNNFSTDASGEIVKNIDDPRIKLIELSFNSGGPARPRNVGIDNAKGEYFAFLDADDTWSDNKLELQLDFMKINKVNFSSTCKSFIDQMSINIDSQYKISRFKERFVKKKHYVTYLNIIL